MNLEEIITAAVEKRVNDIVESSLNVRPHYEYEAEWRPTQVESIVGHAIEEIAQTEVAKHEEKIRAAVVHALSESPTRFEISAYSKIEIPKR